MSYHKWHGYTPTMENASSFYRYINNHDYENTRLWQEFYNNYRDPLWPDCNSYTDLDTLPIEIQNEINEVFIRPVNNIQTELQFVEWLSIIYYDEFVNHSPT